MGKLVRFTANQRAISAQVDEKREAKLILFTGVRYERVSEAKNRKKIAPLKRERKQV